MDHRLIAFFQPGLTLALVISLISVAPALAQGDCLTWGVAVDGYPVTDEQLRTITVETGLKPGMVNFFLQWPAPGTAGAVPKESLRVIHQAGAIPVLTWEPMYFDAQGRETAIPVQNILTGQYDRYISEFARGLRDTGQPLIIRFGHEMNLIRYHWGSDRQNYGLESPGWYQAMFRHVVDIFRREKADKVRWAFCPNAESQPHPNWDGAAWNTATTYFPGHEYVDILGMDGYNWGTSQTKAKHGWDSRWLSFEEIFRPLYGELKKLGPNLPIIVFETSSVRVGGDRSAWIKSALSQARVWGLKGVCWFQVRKEEDWRLLVNQDSPSLELIKAWKPCPRF